MYSTDTEKICLFIYTVDYNNNNNTQSLLSMTSVESCAVHLPRHTWLFCAEHVVARLYFVGQVVESPNLWSTFIEKSQ